MATTSLLSSNSYEGKKSADKSEIFVLRNAILMKVHIEFLFSSLQQWGKNVKKRKILMTKEFLFRFNVSIVFFLHDTFQHTWPSKQRKRKRERSKQTRYAKKNPYGVTQSFKRSLSFFLVPNENLLNQLSLFLFLSFFTFFPSLFSLNQPTLPWARNKT